MDDSMVRITPSMISDLARLIFDVRVANFQVAESRKMGVHPKSISLPENTATEFRREIAQDVTAVLEGREDVFELVARSCPVIVHG